MFPLTRMRRLRASEGLRRLAQETRLDRHDLILPLFVVSGKGRRESVPSLPNVKRVSVDQLGSIARALGSVAVLVFGVPDESQKDERGTAALEEDGLVAAAVRQLKKQKLELVVITDVCLCSYTSHGHCGVLTSSGDVDDGEDA